MLVILGPWEHLQNFNTRTWPPSSRSSPEVLCPPYFTSRGETNVQLFYISRGKFTSLPLYLRPRGRRERTGSDEGQDASQGICNPTDPTPCVPYEHQSDPPATVDSYRCSTALTSLYIWPGFAPRAKSGLLRKPRRPELNRINVFPFILPFIPHC